jgi:hypothetical protein
MAFFFTAAHSLTPLCTVRGQPDSGLYDAIDDPVLKRKVDISMYMLIFINYPLYAIFLLLELIH